MFLRSQRPGNGHWGVIYKEKPHVFTSIGLDNFESEIRLELRPILLACIRRGFEAKEQHMVLKAVSSEIDRNVKICVLYEGQSDAYRMLSVEGTPTFLLYFNGEEIGRILGKVVPEKLVDFVSEQLGQHMSELERISLSSPLLTSEE
jgi:hypothetical protein